MSTQRDYWLHAIIFSLMLGMVLGHQRSYGHYVDQISLRFDITDVSATAMGMAALTLTMTGGIIFCVANYMADALAPDKWKYPILWASSIIGFALWTISVQVIAWSDIDFVIFTSMLYMGSVGAGMFVWGGLYLTVDMISRFKFTPDMAAMTMLIFSADDIYQLGFAIYHRKALTDPAAIPDVFAVDYPYGFQRGYMALSLPAAVLCTIVIIYGITQLWSGLPKFPTASEKPFADEFGNGNKDGTDMVSFLMYCTSAMAFSLVYSIPDVYWIPFLNKGVFTGEATDIVLTGAEMMALGSILGKVVYVGTISMAHLYNNGKTILPNLSWAWAIGTLMYIVGLTFMFVNRFVVMADATIPEYGITLATIMFIKFALGSIMFDYIFTTLVYYSIFPKNKDRQMAFLLFAMAFSPLIALSTAVTGDLTIDHQGLAMWTIGFFIGSMVLNFTSRLFKIGTNLSFIADSVEKQIRVVAIPMIKKVAPTASDGLKGQ